MTATRLIASDAMVVVDVGKLLVLEKSTEGRRCLFLIHGSRQCRKHTISAKVDYIITISTLQNDFDKLVSHKKKKKKTVRYMCMYVYHHPS